MTIFIQYKMVNNHPLVTDSDSLIKIGDMITNDNQ